MAHKSASATATSHRGLDRIDRRLLARLQQDGRAAVSQLAREVHLTVTPTLERVRRLESAGYIEGYFARLNPAVTAASSGIASPRSTHRIIVPES